MFEVMGVTLKGRVDRIDRLPGGELAIVDYKTGGPPTARMVEKGFALQLGTLGLMAKAGAFEGVSGQPTHFEYWSLGKSDKSETDFGYRQEPVLEGRKKTGLPREEFLAITDEFLRDALGRWILGSEPFTARLNPDLPSYGEYDQLMRLDEWMGLGGMSGKVHPLHDNQKRAVDPRETVWLSASAGTGKTQVLSAPRTAAAAPARCPSGRDPLPHFHQGRRGRDGGAGQ